MSEYGTELLRRQLAGKSSEKDIDRQHLTSSPARIFARTVENFACVELSLEHVNELIVFLSFFDVCPSCVFGIFVRGAMRNIMLLTTSLVFCSSCHERFGEEPHRLVFGRTR